MHASLRGLRQNMEELVFTVIEKKIDIASINKNFLRPKHKITIPGYKVIRKDRSTGQVGALALTVKDGRSLNNFKLNINNNKGNVEYLTIKINSKILDELTISSYHCLRGMVFEQLFEKLDNKSNNLLIMGYFNANRINLGSEETNHYGKKLMDTINSYNLLVVQNNNHTRYDSFRDKMGTIDYITIPPNVMANISNVNSKLDNLLITIQ